MESNLTFAVKWGGWVDGDLESKANESYFQRKNENGSSLARTIQR